LDGDVQHDREIRDFGEPEQKTREDVRVRGCREGKGTSVGIAEDNVYRVSAGRYVKDFRLTGGGLEKGAVCVGKMRDGWKFRLKINQGFGGKICDSSNRRDGHGVGLGYRGDVR